MWSLKRSQHGAGVKDVHLNTERKQKSLSNRRENNTNYINITTLLDFMSLIWHLYTQYQHVFSFIFYSSLDLLLCQVLGVNTTKPSRLCLTIFLSNHNYSLCHKFHKHFKWISFQTATCIVCSKLTTPTRYFQQLS